MRDFDLLIRSINADTIGADHTATSSFFLQHVRNTREKQIQLGKELILDKLQLC
ncbi:hypothetical protein Bca4012_057409 [Brassica carinata]